MRNLFVLLVVTALAVPCVAQEKEDLVPTLELVNTSETALSVTPGLRIAQLLLEEAHPNTYQPGRYQLTTKPQIARLSRDRELEGLAALRPRSERA